MSRAGIFASPSSVSLNLAGSSALTPAHTEAGGTASTAVQAKKARRVHIILLRAVLIAVLVRTFIGETSVVPTPSMEGTILVGDHLFWSKTLYGPEIPLLHWRLPRLRKVRRGEIVAFRFPKDPQQTFLKRVAAVGGDTVEIRDGILYVNGAAVEEGYAVHHGGILSSHRWDQMPSRVVPAGQLFVLGDNRDNSSDSRDWGAIPEENVIGSPLFVFWSYDAPSAAWLDQAPTHRLQFYTSMVTHFFTRTRWSRLGTML
jgi:signal peptidase I